MKQLLNLEPFAWIAQNIDSLLRIDDSLWKGNFVSHCLPKGFQSYCKLFHVMSEENPQSLPASEFTGVVAKRRGARVRWRELAAQQGIIFHPEITDRSFTFGRRDWPKNILGPDDGSLDKQTAVQLAHLLAPFTGGQKCFFHYELIATRDMQDVLYVGVLNDILDTFSIDGVYGTPTYWWPEDRSWCVCTDWDLHFTLIGGSRELVAKLLSDTELECVQVEITTRIDYKGDRINSNEDKAVP